MSRHLLSISHSVQEESAGCLAACAQMVMSCLGIDRTQAELNRLLGLTSIGTPYRNIVRLASYGLTVSLQAGTENDLRSAVDANTPPILFLMTGDLPYWQDNTSHAVVLIGYDEAMVMIADPVFPTSPQLATWDELLLAWGEQDCAYAIVTR